jgi:hypothetical protein
MMSLCATCKNPRIDQQSCLSEVLVRISTHQAQQIEELPPNR